MSTWQVLRRAVAAAMAGAAVALGLSAMSSPAAALETVACVSNRLGLVRIVEDEFRCKPWETVRFLGGDGSGVKFVFVTSEQYAANIPSPTCVSDDDIDCNSPLGRADFECNRRAGIVNLPGDFVAWLSTATVDAKDRLPADGGPWFNVKGEHVAPSLPFLTNTAETELYNAIRYNEEGIDVGTAEPWTGTSGNGEATAEHCQSWTITTNTDTATIGRRDRTDMGWTAEGALSCNVAKELYCFGR